MYLSFCLLYFKNGLFDHNEIILKYFLEKVGDFGNDIKFEIERIGQADSKDSNESQIFKLNHDTYVNQPNYLQ